MTNFSNPLGLGGPQPQTGIYRPKYRTRVSNPRYVLDGSGVTTDFEPNSLLSMLDALEEWRQIESEQEKAHSPRWHGDKLKSLLIYIAPAPQPEWVPLILRACREWEAALPGTIHFIPTVRPEEADIHIQWTDSAIEGRPFELGHANRELRAPHWIQRVQITLLTTPEIDKHLSPDQIQQRVSTTVLHELGHALGLEHSTGNKDVMHHQGWKNAQLSTHDRQQLTTLYANPTPTLVWV